MDIRKADVSHERVDLNTTRPLVEGGLTGNRVPTFDAKGPSTRDERLDFIRGFACISFIAAHFEAFTWLNFIFWERLGMFSGAELFVMISGLLLGMVHRRVLETSGFEQSATRLYRRGFQIYCAYACSSLLVLVLARSGWLDMRSLTTFTDFGAAQTYDLMPPVNVPVLQQARDILLLRHSPHQIQILGLYTFLLLVTPSILLALKRVGHWYVIAASAAIWLWNSAWPMMPTGAQFEYGFPLLSWQLYFFCGLALGYRRSEVEHWAGNHDRARFAILAFCGLVAILSFLFAQATDAAAFPPGTRLALIAPETFREIYEASFLKNSLGPARVVCAAAFALCFYWVLGRFWTQAKWALGWLLLPWGAPACTSS